MCLSRLFRCTMQKKTLNALLIGINYKNTRLELQNCIYDALDMKEMLESLFTLDKCVVLTDETDIKPNKENIIQEFKHLAENAKENDNFWIHYSGHGVQQKNHSGDVELDNKDEAIVPLDYKGDPKDLILDDELNQLCSLFKENNNVLMTFDCCHSGTMMDLPYKYTKDRRNRYRSMNNQTRFYSYFPFFYNFYSPYLFGNSMYTTGYNESMLNYTTTESKKPTSKLTNSFIQEKLDHIQSKIKCRLICFSGGLDSQTVSDGMALKNGLFTSSLLSMTKRGLIDDLRVHDMLKMSIEYVDENGTHEQFTQCHSSFEHPINIKLYELFH